MQKVVGSNPISRFLPVLVPKFWVGHPKGDGMQSRKPYLALGAIVAAMAVQGCGSDSGDSNAATEWVEASGEGGDKAASSSSLKRSRAAPGPCLKAWNSDVEALNFGIHNSISHGYTDVQIGYMDERGAASLAIDPAAGECAVVFAAKQPDPEPEVVGQIHRGDHWVPLIRVLQAGELAALQRNAVADANATVNEYGKLRED
jgi:hypothetical protein